MAARLYLQDISQDARRVKCLDPVYKMNYNFFTPRPMNCESGPLMDAGFPAADLTECRSTSILCTQVLHNRSEQPKCRMLRI